MQFKIINTDKVESILISAVNKDVNTLDSIFSAEPKKTPSRIVLRPSEEKIFDLAEGYIAGIERL